jgi:hypothetical protein
MTEQIIFEQGKITSARAVFWDQTYFLSAVTSVRYVELKPDRKWPMFLMIFGVFCVLTTTIILYLRKTCRGLRCLPICMSKGKTQKQTANGSVLGFEAKLSATVDKFRGNLNKIKMHITMHL